MSKIMLGNFFLAHFSVVVPVIQMNKSVVVEAESRICTTNRAEVFQE